jgi:hypothetical protein
VHTEDTAAELEAAYKKVWPAEQQGSRADVCAVFLDADSRNTLMAWYAFTTVWPCALCSIQGAALSLDMRSCFCPTKPYNLEAVGTG